MSRWLIQEKFPGICLVVLLLAALISGVATGFNRLSLLSEWHSASAPVRNEILYDISGPLIARVRQAVPEDGRMLLRSGLDPALLPYYLFPRRIWQTGVDPETNAIYMNLPQSPYPQRQINTFDVDWMLVWYAGNWQLGGDLTFVGSRSKYEGY